MQKPTQTEHFNNDSFEHKNCVLLIVILNGLFNALIFSFLLNGTFKIRVLHVLLLLMDAFQHIYGEQMTRTHFFFSFSFFFNFEIPLFLQWKTIKLNEIENQEQQKNN